MYKVNVMNIVKSFLSFLWLVPFLYMFLDIYFNLDIRLPLVVFKCLIFLSLFCAFSLIAIWYKEFRELSFIKKSFIALQNGDLPMLDTLLTKNDVANFTENNKTLLQYAVDNQLRDEIIIYLLSRDALISYSGSYDYNVSYTLFYLAAYYNYLNNEIIEYLITRGAYVNFIDTSKGFEGLSLVQVFILRGNRHAIALLLNKGAVLDYFVNDLSMNSLMLAAKYVEDPMVIKLLVETDVNIHETNKDGYNALLFACHYNPNPAIVSVLINSGAKISPYNIRSALLQYNEVTPLMIASSYNNADVVKILIKAGDDINFKDNYGLGVVFMAAAHNPNVDVLKTLLVAGVNLDKFKDPEGNTPLMAAAYLNSSLNIIRYLIDKTHNLKAKNHDGFTFIDYLHQNSHLSEQEKELVLQRWI